MSGVDVFNNVSVVGSVKVLNSLTNLSRHHQKDIMTECICRALRNKTGLMFAYNMNPHLSSFLSTDIDTKNPPTGPFSFQLSPTSVEGRRSDMSIIFKFDLRSISMSYVGSGKIMDCLCIVHRNSVTSQRRGLVLKSPDAQQIETSLQKFFTLLQRSEQKRNAWKSKEMIFSKPDVTPAHRSLTDLLSDPPGSSSSTMEQSENSQVNIYYNLMEEMPALEKSSAPANSKKKISSPVSTTVDFFDYQLHFLLDSPIFHGEITEEAAQTLLTRGGDYLLRLDCNFTHQIILSVCTPDNIIRHLMLISTDGKIKLKNSVFRTIDEMMLTHSLKKIPIKYKKSAMYLDNPVFVKRNGSII